MSSAKYIILTAQQAAVVQGPTSQWSSLEPFLLADGVTYILPVEVLDDEFHAIHHEYLATLPVREVAPEEWPVDDPVVGRKS